ncbi:MAG: hypothetical protein ACYTFK_13000 [Planctomycetota bacterium]|jgi:hypothetical protein
MLSTVELVNRELRKTKEDAAEDEAAVLDAIDRLVRTMENDQRLKNSFVAEIGDRYYDAQWSEFNGPINSNGVLELTPNSPLLSLTSLSFDDDDAPSDFTTVDSENILLLPRGNVNKTQIKLLNSEQWPFDASNREGAIKVSGEWAWHDDPAKRWLDSNDSVQATMNSSTNSVVVNDASGSDYWLDSPRFSPGQLVKIDSEYMSVRAVSTDNGTLSVMRAQRGTTAAGHGTLTTIYNWSGAQAAQDFVTRAAALQYRRRGEFIDTKVEGITEIHWPTAQTMPEYRILLQLHNMGRIFSA